MSITDSDIDFARMEDEPIDWEYIYDNTKGLRDFMEAYVMESGEILDYDDVDAIMDTAWDWFSQDPEEFLERFRKP